MMDTAVLIFRLLLGAILFAHAAQKLFGWFGGNGLRKQATIFESLGLKPGVPMVVMAGTLELLAATLLVLGLGTPLAALVGSGTMLVAGLTMHVNSGRFWNSAGGGEYPYVLAAAMAAVGVGGAGRYALDRFLASEWPALSAWLEPSWIHALAIPALAVVSALPFALLLRRGQH
ncbi:MAG: DoxX family protein [Arthrobacter sp.]